MGIMSNSSQGDTHCRESKTSEFSMALLLSYPYSHLSLLILVLFFFFTPSFSPNPSLIFLCVHIFFPSTLFQARGDFRASIQPAARWWGCPDLCFLWWLSWGWCHMAGRGRAQPDREYHHFSCGQWRRAVYRDQCINSGAGAQQYLQLPTDQPNTWRGGLHLCYSHRWDL